MKKLQKHIIFSIITFIGWLTFLLLGLPSYYVEWQSESIILLILLWAGGIAPWLVFITLYYVKGDYLQNSIVFALYGSLGIFILDLIFIGIIQGQGFSFLNIKTHPVQIIGYFIVLIEFPCLGLIMKKFSKTQNQSTP